MRVLGYGMMGLRVGLFLALICIRISDIAAQDAAALQALTESWGNLPPSWNTGDPCGNSWEGITCRNSRIVGITLANMDLMGQLSGDLATLSELRILDLSYNQRLTGPLPPSIGQLTRLTNLILVGCRFSGRIPNSVGSLEQLVYLSLNENRFTGEVPASIGNLRNLYWLDLADNQLTGSIPVSSGDTPGLDLLVNTKHFHFGKNRLSGPIPRSLFNSSMTLIHVLFDNNELTGSIPSTLGLVRTLEAVRFDRNSLSGDLPTNIGNLSNVNELVLSNNALTGPIPDLSGMESLSLLDLSNNSFEATEVPRWIATLQSLTTLMMEETSLEGSIPDEFFNIPQLQIVRLRNNQINGTFGIGSSYSSQLQLIDLQNNSIGAVTVAPGYNFTLMLADNPFCQDNRVSLSYCNIQQNPGSSYTTLQSCPDRRCPSEQISSPICNCAYPFTGTFIFRAPSSFGNSNYFRALQVDILRRLQIFRLPVESVAIRDVDVDEFGYLNMHLAVFPAGIDYFNRTGVISLAFVFSNQTYKPPEEYGPYVFRADIYTHFEGRSRDNSRTGIIVGAAIGASILLLLLICAGGYAYFQKKRAKKAKQQANPFVSWDPQGTGGDVPQLKGARFFTLEELQKCTHNFSEANNIGSGGYGKVYKGILPDGQMIAIKRSQHGSMQGSREFKNEVELLSRVHHKNLVKLVGFCFDKGEQTLVYEFIPNGTLMESLSGKSGIRMDWIRRLMVTLGSARGLQYLHELADPPIIHRDIKSNNILLDERLTAKVADFGLSKLFGDTDQKGYVTTQVKGTMGYLDPEYFMTNQLTEKSDVFSFGVVMLEMVTARQPIQDGKYIVKEIKEAMDRTKDLYNLERVMDTMLVTNTSMLVGFEKFVDLALKCVQDEGMYRPTMGEVVKEIEHIVKLAGMNPNADSAAPSQTYDGVSGGNFSHPYSDNSLFSYSGTIPLTRPE
ncbi:leucine-rich repeat receptor protein kinase HPCA1 [Spinacia oleracea]|uniref:non-specific serine/threonine protein kinase n=1 Tax=Spinacia oleracea TaxID=3562 RepID=A0A9R0K927_SPIOL|nr:leucine-rich repeat receptor protein kinase HPCA1-like [Spinacia oleracea]